MAEVILGWALYLSVKSGYAGTLHSDHFETQALCVSAATELQKQFPDEIKGWVCAPRVVGAK